MFNYWGRARSWHLVALGLLAVGATTSIGCLIIGAVYWLFGQHTTIDWSMTAVALSTITWAVLPATLYRNKIHREQCAVIDALSGKSPN